jgi:putative acetyltransferase
VSAIAIRSEASADAAAVRHLLQQAFDGPAEATLVDQLRADGDLVLALVADGDQAITGYVAFPRLQMEGADTLRPAVGLAPLAVAEAERRRGVGAALVRTGLDQLAAGGEQIVFVLGDPAYYCRFGFDLEAAAPFRCVYAGEHFMACRLATNAPRDGKLRYPAAFDSLG